jgi:hypothetical protein
MLLDVAVDQEGRRAALGVPDRAPPLAGRQCSDSPSPCSDFMQALAPSDGDRNRASSGRHGPFLTGSLTDGH